jgi:hypothetical protein
LNDRNVEHLESAGISIRAEFHAAPANHKNRNKVPMAKWGMKMGDKVMNLIGSVPEKA